MDKSHQIDIFYRASFVDHGFLLADGNAMGPPNIFWMFTEGPIAQDDPNDSLLYIINGIISIHHLTDGCTLRKFKDP